MRTITVALLGATAMLLAVLALMFFIAVRSSDGGRQIQFDIAVIVTTVLAFGSALACAAWGVVAELRRRGRMKTFLPTAGLVIVAPFLLTFLAFVIAHRLFPALQVDRHGNPVGVLGFLLMCGGPVIVGLFIGPRLLPKVAIAPQGAAQASDDAPSVQDGWVDALEAGYRTTLDRIRAAGDASQRALVDPLLTGQASAVREAGQEKMVLTAKDGKEHSVAWTLSKSVMLAVQTVPAGRESVAGWYTAEFKGYLGYVSAVVTPLLESSGADVFVHVIFGQDKGADGWQPWTSIAFLPARPGAISPLLPRTCCNAEERARYGL